MRLYQSDLTALSSVYDRYSRLVFLLAQQAVPTLSDVIVEDVFIDLWCASTHAPLTPPLLGPLLDLTAAAVIRHGVLGQLPQETNGGRRILAGLVPFSGLSGRAFDVLVLRCLGQLTVEEVAITLEQTPAMIRATLTTGLATLRNGSELGRRVGDGAECDVP
jgi:hypothetical protein